MSTLQERFDQATKIIDEHNVVLTGGDKKIFPIGYVYPETFVSAIKSMGGTSTERLDKLTVEDVLRCLPGDRDGIRPMLLAKDLIKVLRPAKEFVGSGVDATEGPEPGQVITAKKAEKMTVLELIFHYDPQDDNAVAKRLKGMSNGKPFIVFNEDGTVDSDNTMKLLAELYKGYEPRTLLVVAGVPKQIYAVGDRLDAFADENPLYPNRPLRPDGTCDQTNRSWEGVPINVRQLLYLIVTLRQVTMNLEKAHDLLDVAVDSGLEAWANFTTRYPYAVSQFKELERLGNLPKLKVRLTPRKEEPKRPFDPRSAMGKVKNARTGTNQVRSADDIIRKMRLAQKLWYQASVDNNGGVTWTSGAEDW